MQAPRVIVVLLRRPSKAATERRDDPFWEMGSFGCTGCHSRNLMNPKRAIELNGAHLAFVQGGPTGFRLVYVTPKIWMEPLANGFEARWSLGRMPLSYRFAPLVIDNRDHSDIPLLARESRGGLRSTPVARFASAFRSRRLPVSSEVGAAIIACYREWQSRDHIAKTYVDAMPYPPAIVEHNREKRYQAIRKSRRVMVGCRARRAKQLKACVSQGP